VGSQTVDDIRSLENRLREIEEEKTRLLTRLAVLKAAESPLVACPVLGRPVSDRIPESTTEKINLFLKLFRCRESVYPKLWENRKKGTKGYSPACRKEWAPICHKPRIKCIDCSNKDFQPFDAVAADAHLRGQMTIGTYAIREDDTCVFLACDFDGPGWHVDIECYRTVGEQLGIQVAVERSRSGNGGHAWIFFVESVPARLARILGTLILARCNEIRHTIELESYDRFFPNQDFLPKGGFGNLIALPLQHGAREQDNSVFIDPFGQPHANQWEYLARVRRLSSPEVMSLVRDFLPSKLQLQSPEDDAALLTADNILENMKDDCLAEDSMTLAGRVLEIGYGAQIEIPLAGLSSRLISRLKRTASFPNPEFFKSQRMRMSTYRHRPFIFSGELQDDRLVLPRGVLEKATAILRKAGARVVVRDERLNRKGLAFTFTGTLGESQESAVNIMKKHDTGILSAPPGAGKTVMACAMVAHRKAPTLILVHRKQLVTQWRDRLMEFLGLGKKEIGTLAGTSKKRNGKLDIAMLQSLTRTEELEEIAGAYSQIIVDECHHIPAASFEAVMKRFPARYVLGLTATPYRKDRLEKILFHQCGPVRHEIRSADNGRLAKRVIIKETGFRLPDEAGPKPDYHALVHHLTTNALRTGLIAGDVIRALGEGRFPLLLSDRKNHLAQLAALITEGVQHKPALAGLRLLRMDGELSAKARVQVMADVHAALEQSTPVAILATASLIGEGFDLPELDTLVLAMPLSFKGRMVQYAGRLHRLAEGKTGVVVYDYVDSSCAVTLKMYRNRIKAYREMGYAIEQPADLLGPLSG